jgi:hypothetical protein
VTVIIASGLCVIAFFVFLAVALSRVAARADEESERWLAERRANAPIKAYRMTYAGFARAQATVASESSIAVGASRIGVGDGRGRVSSQTAQRLG